MAKIVNVFKKKPVDLKPEEPFVVTTDVESIEMSFTPEEFLTLGNILGKIGGKPPTTARKYAESIYDSIDYGVLGVYTIDKDNPFRTSEDHDSIYYEKSK